MAAGGVDLLLREKAWDGRPILRDVALGLQENEVAAVMGPSGCGKSSLLGILAGLDRDWRGSLACPPDIRLGIVFQSPRLLPWRSLWENIALMRPALPEDELRAMLEALGLGDHLDSHPERLSLGQQRRAAIGRALAVKPGLLLLDEPFASLDAASAACARRVMAGHLARHPATTLIVTHDAAEVAGLARRIVTLGGSPATVIADRVLSPD